LGTNLRLVLDTDVIVAGFRSDRGASRQILLAAFERQFVMLVSVPLMLEYESVLTRPEQMRETGLTTEETGGVLDALSVVIEPVQLRFLWRPKLKDPTDEMVLETAFNGQADCLVTFNTRHLRDAARELSVRVAPPGEIWREMRGGKSEAK
jgi:putative PIN family toxin of toxin-antitoxin system